MVGPPSLGGTPRETVMSAEDPRTLVSTAAESQPGGGLLVRLGWMGGGTLTMLIAGFVIVSRPTWTFSGADAAFWAGALLAIVLRYLDVARYGGDTARGEPATMGHFTRYAVGVVGIGLAYWTMAQSVHI